MKQIPLISQSFEETRALGKRLAKCAKPGDIVCLFGDLGSGKTTMIKGLAAGLGAHEEDVTSPTFVFLNVYDQLKWPLYHFDLYRLEETDELFDIGYEEFLYGDGIAVVEWSERLEEFLPKERLDIYLKHKGEDSREIRLKAFGKRYEQMLKTLEGLKA